jgi:predicted DNA-binding transcriptional regulator YafY
MPLSFAEAIRRSVDRITFIAEQEEKAPRRKPKRVGKTPAYGTLYALRNVRMSIREAALRLAQLLLTYQKETTGETKKYIVAPYSYRYRRLKSGIRKLLFAYDFEDRHIKGFVVGNIKKAAITDRKFRPMWPVEIS